MDDPLVIVEKAIGSVRCLHRALSKNTSIQVSSSDECSLVKATALTWRESQRTALTPSKASNALQTVDRLYRDLLEFSGRRTTRDRYNAHLKKLKAGLSSLRSEVINQPEDFTGVADQHSAPPDFSGLVPDAAMRRILSRRWDETQRCLGAGAHLAATVMMGGLLEALLLGRVNLVDDKSKLFKGKAVPKNKKTGKLVPLQEWTLQVYIDVAHEAGWIRQSAKDVSVVLRDYRNYIHPAKELSHGIALEEADTAIFWLVVKSLTTQIVKSV